MYTPLADGVCMALSRMVAVACGVLVLQQSLEDTRPLRQHQGFVLPRDVAHQRQPDGGVILVVAEILDPVAIGIKEIHAGGHPVVGIVVQSDTFGLKLFVGLFGSVSKVETVMLTLFETLPSSISPSNSNQLLSSKNCNRNG
jgi:hypothetical protein